MITLAVATRLQGKFDQMDGRWRNRKWLVEKKVDAEVFTKLAIPILFLCIQRKDTLVQAAIKIGNSVRKHYMLEDKTEFSLGGGLMLLESFIEEDVLRWYESNSNSNRHSTYYLQVKDWGKWKSLKDEIIEDDEKLPFDGWPEQNSDWVSGYNEKGLPFIRDAHRKALLAVGPDTHPLLLSAVNKLQRTEYCINQELYAVWKEFRAEAKNKRSTKPSPFKFVGEKNKQRAISYIIEADTIEMMVDRLLDEPIYHTYNCDFRGRIYNTTVFLEEQASDQAKALLQYADGVPLGSSGLLWLMIYAANMYGNDKISLNDRVSFVEESMEEFVEYARDPMGNRGWLEADKPWSFLMCCMELASIANWCDNGFDYESFPSKVICYIDGSNNGIQHLVAMSRDHSVAPYVNLVATEGDDSIPGDVYMYVAGKVWEKIDRLAQEASQEVRDNYDKVKDDFFEIAQEIYFGNSKAEKKEAHEKLVDLKDSIGDSKDIAAYAPLWWNQFKDDAKIQRKMVKRNVMTIGYGATKGGMGQQAKDDIPDIFEDARWIPGGWHFWFGALVYDTCYEHLDGPANMLRMFRSVADKCNSRDEFLSYDTPHTDFPVIQNYRKARTKRAEFNFCNKTIKPRFLVMEEKDLDKQKQLSSTAPNVTHSLDAAHLTMVVARSPFSVTTVHDSFGCHAGNMEELFVITREQFLELYSSNPLVDILTQAQCEELIPTPKEWLPESIMESDFAFC